LVPCAAGETVFCLPSGVVLLGCWELRIVCGVLRGVV
jgi:hypothetical protein